MKRILKSIIFLFLQGFQTILLLTQEFMFPKSDIYKFTRISVVIDNRLFTTKFAYHANCIRLLFFFSTSLMSFQVVDNFRTWHKCARFWSTQCWDMKAKLESYTFVLLENSSTQVLFVLSGYSETAPRRTTCFSF